MTNVTSMALELKRDVMWQATPTELSLTDYINFIIHGIRRLYVDTGRASAYSDDMVVHGKETMFAEDIPLDEREYVLLIAHIDFFKKVQADNNTRVSYTTDALSVTGGDKPYAHLRDTIEKLENERRILYYKMTTYVFPNATD